MTTIDEGDLERGGNSVYGSLRIGGRQCLLSAFLRGHAVRRAQRHAHHLRYIVTPESITVSCSPGMMMVWLFLTQE